MDAGQELFLTTGYLQTTVQDIVKKVGIAQGTFYYHFISKEALLEAIITRHVKAMINKVQLLDKAEATPLEKLQLFINLFYRLCCDGEPGLIYDMLYREKQGELINKLWRQTQILANPLLVPIIEDCNAQGLTKVIYLKETLWFFGGIIASLLESTSPTEYGHETDPAILENKTAIAQKLIERLFDAPPGSIHLNMPSSSTIEM